MGLGQNRTGGEKGRRAGGQKGKIKKCYNFLPFCPPALLPFQYNFQG